METHFIIYDMEGVVLNFYLRLGLDGNFSSLRADGARQCRPVYRERNETPGEHPFQS